MKDSETVSEVELRQLIIEAMVHAYKEKQYNRHTEERPYLWIDAPMPPPLEKMEEDTPEQRSVVVVDI